MKIFIESCWQSMIGKNRSGFGAYEMLTVCVMLLIIVAFALANVFKTDYKEKYDVMEYNARMFSLSANNVYLVDGTKSLYTLQMLIDKKIHSNIKNPFQGTKYCDSNLSKVEFKNGKRYVTLECGNYLIYNQNALDDSYTIYRVSKWSDEKGNKDNQKVVFYNYQVDGKDVFKNDLEKDTFLYEYNKINGTEYKTIKEIPDSSNVSKKTMYRNIEKVSD